jgi:DNA-binding MarR family transcriptional regulator
MRTKKHNRTPDQLSLPEFKAMQFIEVYIAARRQPPTVRDISDVINLSVGATHDLVNRLIEYGYLTRKTKRRSRRNLVVRRSVQE